MTTIYRDKVRPFQITPHLARRGTRHGSGLGVYRWVVEGAIALLHWFRRLRIRWAIRDDIRHAFVTPRLRRHLLATTESQGRRCAPGDGLLDASERMLDFRSPG
jgi:hypothetical protein